MQNRLNPNFNDLSLERCKTIYTNWMHKQTNEQTNKATKYTKTMQSEFHIVYIIHDINKIILFAVCSQIN